MKEEILSIASDLREGSMSTNEAKEQLLVLFGVVGRSGQFSFADMKDAFNAGDKFRLYLDKNAVGLGYPHDKDVPTSDNVMKTMRFDKWIESKR